MKKAYWYQYISREELSLFRENNAQVQQLRKLITTSFLEGSHFLVFGSQNYKLLQLLIDLSIRVTCVDVNKQQVERKNRLSSVSYVICDPRKLNFPVETFDGIIILNGWPITALGDDLEIWQSLKSLNCVLKEAGTLFLHTFHISALLKRKDNITLTDFRLNKIVNDGQLKTLPSGMYIRWFSFPELKFFLRSLNFGPVEGFHDFDLNPLKNSLEFVIVTKKTSLIVF